MVSLSDSLAVRITEMATALNPKTKSRLAVPAEAIALVVRAFGELRRTAVERMSPPQLTREIKRALHVLVVEPAPGQRFVVGDIVRFESGKMKDGSDN
jgi:hypothetical protein